MMMYLTIIPRSRGKYLSLGTDTEEDNCFSIKLAGEYHY